MCLRKDQTMEMKNCIPVLVSFIVTCVFKLCAGIPVGEVDMGGNHVLIKGLAGIIPCRFYGQPLAVHWGKEDGKGPLISWYGGRTYAHFPTNDSSDKKLDILEDYSLVIYNVDTDDTGRYACEVSDFRGSLIGNRADVVVAIPPSRPFPLIENCTIAGGRNCSSLCHLRADRTASAPVKLSCRANGASEGLTLLSWKHGGSEYHPVKISRVTNADGSTENVTAVIDAFPSDTEYTCLLVLNATKSVTANASVTIPPSCGIHVSWTPNTNISDNENETDNTDSVDKWTDIPVTFSAIARTAVFVGVLAVGWIRWKYRNCQVLNKLRFRKKLTERDPAAANSSSSSPCLSISVEEAASKDGQDGENNNLMDPSANSHN